MHLNGSPAEVQQLLQLLPSIEPRKGLLRLRRDKSKATAHTPATGAAATALAAADAGAAAAAAAPAGVKKECPGGLPGEGKRESKMSSSAKRLGVAGRAGKLRSDDSSSSKSTAMVTDLANSSTAVAESSLKSKKAGGSSSSSKSTASAAPSASSYSGLFGSSNAVNCLSVGQEADYWDMRERRKALADARGERDRVREKGRKDTVRRSTKVAKSHAGLQASRANGEWGPRTRVREMGQYGEENETVSERKEEKISNLVVAGESVGLTEKPGNESLAGADGLEEVDREIVDVGFIERRDQGLFRGSEHSSKKKKGIKSGSQRKRVHRGESTPGAVKTAGLGDGMKQVVREGAANQGSDKQQQSKGGSIKAVKGGHHHRVAHMLASEGGTSESEEALQKIATGMAQAAAAAAGTEMEGKVTIADKDGGDGEVGSEEEEEESIDEEVDLDDTVVLINGEPADVLVSSASSPSSSNSSRPLVLLKPTSGSADGSVGASLFELAAGQLSALTDEQLASMDERELAEWALKSTGLGDAMAMAWQAAREMESEGGEDGDVTSGGMELLWSFASGGSSSIVQGTGGQQEGEEAERGGAEDPSLSGGSSRSDALLPFFPFDSSLHSDDPDCESDDPETALLMRQLRLCQAVAAHTDLFRRRGAGCWRPQLPVILELPAVEAMCNK